MIVIFTQTDYTANFTTTQRTISDFNFGSVARGLLILFLNGMKKSSVSITNTNFYAGNIIPDTNQVGGCGITIHSFNCGKCSSGTLDHPWFYPIYLDTVYIKGESQISKHKYVSTFYMDIHESCTNDFKQFFLRKLNFTIGFFNHFQPGMYAVGDPLKLTILLFWIAVRLHNALQILLVYTLKLHAAMTFVNWKNVTICGESYFQSPILSVYNTNLFVQGRNSPCKIFQKKVFPLTILLYVIIY